MIDIMLDIDAGSRWDPSGLEGLASVVAGMLLKDIIRWENCI